MGDKSREEVLQNSILYTYKIYYISSPNQKEEISDFIEQLKDKKNNISLKYEQFISVDKIGSSQFRKLLSDSSSSTKIIICINQALLRDSDSVINLIDLFLGYDSRLFVDSNSIFLFSKSVINNESDNSILNLSSKMHYFKYWQTELKTVGDALEDIPDTVKTVIEEEKNKIEKITKGILKLLDSLTELYKVGWDFSLFEPNKYVEVIQPLLARINGYKVQKLEDITRSLEDKHSRDLLCVISYENYFEDTEKEEMETYFKNFYGKLSKNHNIHRIFCIKGYRNNRGKYYSLYSKELNKNIYDFLTLFKSDPEHKHKAYLLVYVESPLLVEDYKIFYEQDYILSIPKQKGIKYLEDEDLTEKIITNLKESKEESKEESKLDVDMFFTHPEDETGENKMIKLSNQNLTSVKKWIADFIFRINKNSKTSNHFIVDSSEEETIKQILNIKDKKETKFKLHSHKKDE